MVWAEDSGTVQLSIDNAAVTADVDSPSQTDRKSTQRERLIAGMVEAARRHGYAGANVSQVISHDAPLHLITASSHSAGPPYVYCPRTTDAPYPFGKR